MARKNRDGYSGAVGRTFIADVLALDPKRYAVQPKIDGCYAELHLDGDGRIASVLSRTGRPYGPAIVGDLLGALVGAPRAVIAGELEAHTEEGNRVARRRGYRQVHLFDALHDGTRSLAAEPYRARRDALWRMQSAVAGPEFVTARWEHGHRWRRVDGPYCRGPRDWRIAPVVPQLQPQVADDLWDRVLADALEGLVVVALDAPLGRRGAKLKCKLTESLDCVVLSCDGRAAVVRTFGQVFTVPGYGLDLSPGAVVEVCHNGRYADGTPRFARVKRERRDLQGVHGYCLRGGVSAARGSR